MKIHVKQVAYLLVVVTTLVVSVFFYNRSNRTTLSPHMPEDSREPTSENIELVGS